MEGGSLPVRNGVYYDVKHGEDTEWLISLYDERLQHSNLLGDVGSVRGLKIASDLQEGDYDLWIARPNIWQIRQPVLWPTDEEFARAASDVQLQHLDGLVPNYVWAPISLKPFYEKAKLFRETLTQVWTCSPEEFASFLTALGRRQWTILLQSPAIRIQIMERGYGIDTRGKFLNEILASIRSPIQSCMAHVHTNEP